MNSFSRAIAPHLVTLLMLTLRIKVIRKSDLPPKAVYIFWHGKMLGGWWALRSLRPGALVSQSKDGELLSALLKKWGYTLFRGSSSSGGKAALMELSDFIRQGNSGAITPDGPRGPAKYLKNGALILSMQNNIPVVPMNVEYSAKKILTKSWDNFEIPMPFSKCTITFGESIRYSALLEGQELDDFKNSLAAEL